MVALLQPKSTSYSLNYDFKRHKFVESVEPRQSHTDGYDVDPREFDLGNGSRRSRTDQHFGEPIVRIEDVSYCYSGGEKAIDGLNLVVRAGEVHALIGPSGAGKTTTTKLVNGLIAPSQGRVWVGDEEITGNTDIRKLASKVATVFENPDVMISERYVKDEIAFPLKQRQHQGGWFSRQKCYDDNYIDNQVSQTCKMVGINEELLDRDPILLPYGQRKLVTIAEALTLNPEVLLLDEPIIGLGASARHTIRHTIQQVSEQGKAVLLVSNDIDFVAEVADTVTILNQGKVVVQDALHTVFNEDNWQRLGELNIYPPRSTQLARRFGKYALSCDELVSALSSQSGGDR